MAAIALCVPVLMLGVLLALGWYEDGMLSPSRGSARHPEDPSGTAVGDGAAPPQPGEHPPG